MVYFDASVLTWCKLPQLSIFESNCRPSRALQLDNLVVQKHLHNRKKIEGLDTFCDYLEFK